MMPMVERLKSLCLLLVGLLLVACAHNDGSAAWRSYPDAVVNINQVDPAYRAYFRSQHGSNYSLRDQREAFMAATRTARTPVPQQAERPKPKPVARRGKAAPRGKAKAAPSKGSKAKGKAKAAPKGRKAATGKKAKAKPKSTKRRR